MVACFFTDWRDKGGEAAFTFTLITTIGVKLSKMSMIVTH